MRTVKLIPDVLTIMFIGAILSSCDPDFSVEYFVTNSTDNDIQIKIYKLSDPYLGLTSYDTIILKDKSVKFYSYGQIGEYRNPSDTITIFDSLVVTKNNIKSLKYFKQLSEWNYSIKESYHLYQLDIKSSDF